MTEFPTPAVGIDLGTTYSTIACLNDHGEPITVPNIDGEFSTPSVLLYENGEVIVGTHALRTAVANPERVIQESKRFMGDDEKQWVIDGRTFTPVDVAAEILGFLLATVEQQTGPVKHAVITVPVMFGDAQRRATIEAAHLAGLEKVDLINEPVAAALCHVLGSEGLWFTELAETQRIFVFDLGGGTLDLSIVQYNPQSVSVIAGAGDLKLGGNDWNRRLIGGLSKEFEREFGSDPKSDLSSLQTLTNEIEAAKRSLTSRNRVPVTIQHGGERKTYEVRREQFERMTAKLVERAEKRTLALLKRKKFGWAHIDTVLTTGGASRMPMIREMLKRLSGTTLNTALSPDLSVAHGACYFAGILLSNNDFARSLISSEQAAENSRQVSARTIAMKQVSGRSLGVLVRDTSGHRLIPHYVIPKDTPLPAEVTFEVATIIPSQKQVRLPVIEEQEDEPDSASQFNPIGRCELIDLPAGLDTGTPLDVTIRYDRNAVVNVTVKERSSGRTGDARLRANHVDDSAPSNPPSSTPTADSISLKNPPPKPRRTRTKPTTTAAPSDRPSITEAGEEEFWQTVARTGSRRRRK
ncbi:Hsp70 family protein [Stratiformator vulcanicus]|uniref:Chaperone protein DnaK n=1 Tax=Stratiformator vulcanicus TaxID=2527980 RepID=A0A517R6K6_9PLAN|nr:Hsp70 family protein [Stratiformator vulcanicus]QDT39537.1 Chaperone protein DnaK [Stratiformator vulcanicus]